MTWSHHHQPPGLTPHAERLYWLAKLVAQAENRWGDNDRMLAAALNDLGDFIEKHPAPILLTTPIGREALEKRLSFAVDEAINTLER